MKSIQLVGFIESNIKRGQINYLYTLMILILCMSCNDEIDYQLVRPEPGQQKILVEEVSGVRCPNCPDGTRLLTSIASEFDSAIIVVTYHAGFFSVPYPESVYDFKTEETVALLNLLGNPIGYPSAAIQRLKDDGQSSAQRLTNTWYSTINQLIADVPELSLHLEVDQFGEDTQITYGVLTNDDIDRPLYGHLYLLEDGLIDYQSDSRASDGVVTNYEHNHVLKKILTPLEGELLGNSFAELSRVNDSMTLQLSSIEEVVDPAKTSFVFFVTDDEKVLQVEKAYNNP
ncbi:Omp28-related outer membrane protein [Membranihabitans marinus]|uniref:Omp28-related outer membrane protein n=1 Tax=Membranihabitans marinus TaxID=1227546 RepID=UPI001F39005E|nr:Omp28-related outer membrane protein [Membranihabitans marinus]